MPAVRVPVVRVPVVRVPVVRVPLVAGCLFSCDGAGTARHTSFSRSPASGGGLPRVVWGVRVGCWWRRVGVWVAVGCL